MSVDTTSLYLDALESAYLVFSCPYFAWSARKRMIRNRKYYPVDTGLRQACVVSEGRDLGKSLECAAYLRLRQRFGEVCYWRDRGEVDFIVSHKGKPTPIQVTWDEPKDRHLKSLDAVYEAHPQSGEGVFFTAADLVSEDGVPAMLTD